MRVDPDRLKGLAVGPRVRRYSRRDARLYALGVGFGADPLDEPDLDFVVDRPEFRVVPSMATTFGDAVLDLTLACELERPDLAVHARQELECLAPLPDAAEIEVDATITGVFDRGADRGAEIHMRSDAVDRGSGRALFRATYVTVARGDGGFAGEAPPRTPQIRLPDVAPDHVVEARIAASQALLFALNGDPNPIHTHPAAARRAGFDRPILHGLCTYGMACRAVLRCFCGNDPARMLSFDTQFAAPVYPGETLRFEMFASDDGAVFEARAVERDVVVLRNGRCRLDA